MFRLIVVLFITPLFFSCGNSSQNSNRTIDNSEDTQEENITEAKERNERKEQSIQIIPVYYEKNHNGMQLFSFYFALKQGNNFIKFDNDQDYKEYVQYFPILTLIENVRSSVINNLIDQKIINFNYKTRCISMEEVPIVDEYTLKIIEDVLLYWNGEKDKIKDKDIYKIIDEDYYNTHTKDIGSYELAVDRYNYKRYKFYKENGQLAFGVFLEPKPEIKDDKLFILDGELPDDALIITISN